MRITRVLGAFDEAVQVRLPVRLHAPDGEMAEMLRAESLRTPAHDAIAMRLERSGGSVPFTDAVRQFREETGFVRGWAATAAVNASMGAGAFVNSIRKAVHRKPRPFIVNPKLSVVGDPPSSSSFPSGHTTMSHAGASALALFWPQKRAELLQAAEAVGASRSYMGVHFPRDVREGARSGTRTGTVVASPLEWITRPTAGPRTARYGVLALGAGGGTAFAAERT